MNCHLAVFEMEKIQIPPPLEILLYIVVAQGMAAPGHYSGLVVIYLDSEQEYFAETLSVGSADSKTDSLEIDPFSALIEVEPDQQPPVKHDAPIVAVVVLANPYAAAIAEVVAALFVGSYGEMDVASYIDGARSSQRGPTGKPAGAQPGPFEILAGEQPAFLVVIAALKLIVHAVAGTDYSVALEQVDSSAVLTEQASHSLQDWRMVDLAGGEEARQRASHTE